MAQSIDNQKLTPAMRQYHHFKSQYADAILFFRMGDFYETFYEDAKTSSQVLGIAQTSRSKGKDPIPLAGIPYHALSANRLKTRRWLRASSNAMSSASSRPARSPKNRCSTNEPATTLPPSALPAR